MHEPVSIDPDYLTSRLKALLVIPSPTGFTDEAVRYTARELERLGLEVMLTRRGAIRALRPGAARRPARGIVSHLDTLGAQVKALKDNGRLEVVSIGHWSARFAEGARVSIFSSKGIYRGSILPLKASGHTFNSEVDSQPSGWPYVELRVDALSRHRHDLAQLGIDVGGIVSVDPQPEFLENGFIVSRHIALGQNLGPPEAGVCRDHSNQSKCADACHQVCALTAELIPTLAARYTERLLRNRKSFRMFWPAARVSGFGPCLAPAR